MFVSNGIILNAPMTLPIVLSVSLDAFGQLCITGSVNAYDNICVVSIIRSIAIIHMFMLLRLLML
jgi:hypothetical protein